MSDEEQQFTIQPHPAKDNVPPAGYGEETAGFGSAPTLDHLPKGKDGSGGARGLVDTISDKAKMESIGATQAKGPHVPSQDLAQGLEQPKSREELQARQAELNK